MSLSNSTANGKAATIKSTFSRQTAVSIDIKASAEIIWGLLTHASAYPLWNSTVTSMEGNIAPGGKIKLKSVLDAKRVFSLTISEFKPNTKLVWGDAMGKRTFNLTQKGPDMVTFTMSEKIGGPLFPLFAGMIPSFDATFEQFAADLKKESEKQMSTHSI
jgi:uncharacterized protein YndB with AHSA1/START domain